MENSLHIWLPLGLNLVGTIIAIVWSWAKMDKKITIVDMKVDAVGKDLKEVKTNHLRHLDEKIDMLGCKFTDHLISHNRGKE